MPYVTTSQLPPAVRRLPLHGQEIFLSAFNNAWQTYADRGFNEREEIAFRSPGPRSKSVTASAARYGSPGACKRADRERHGADQGEGGQDGRSKHRTRAGRDGSRRMVFRAGLDRRVAGGAADPRARSPPASPRSAASRDLVECKVPPRHGSLTREVLAINMVMAGCKPEYAPVVRAAMLALTAKAFNLNGVQATTHMAGPLLIVNGPLARAIGMNGGGNAFGSGNRANATIGRAIRLILLNVGGGWPGDLDKIDPGPPRQIHLLRRRERGRRARWRPITSKRGLRAEDSTVFVIAAEPPHSVTNHVADDPEGILDSICSAMSTIANNNAVSSGHCAVVIGPEHARTIAGKGWTRHDVRSYLHMNAYNLFSRARLRPPLRQGLQPQSAALVQARARFAHPGRAEPRPHPFVRDRRRGRPVFGLHPRLGPYVVAGLAGDRGRRGHRAWSRFASTGRVICKTGDFSDDQQARRHRLRPARAWSRPSWWRWRRAPAI